MGIYRPDVRLNAQDKRLLVLLAAILAHGQGAEIGHNHPPESVVISDAEARELIDLLEEFASSKKFIESAYFVENLALGPQRPDSNLREIYLSWRARHGRRRALSSAHWREFLNRLGLEQFKGGYLAASAEIRAEEMSLSHFLRMERLLLQDANVDDRVKHLILKVITQHLSKVDEMRHGERSVKDGALARIVNSLVAALKADRQERIPSGHMSASKIAGVMTLVADTSVMFTTRDWGVAGTLSTMAAAAVASAGD